MASNEPRPLSPFRRLADALEAGGGGGGGGGTRALAEAIQNGDPDQLQYWHELIAAVPLDELQQRLSEDDFQGLLGAVHLLMQWEQAQAEELKDILERETNEMAEREESLVAERDTLKAELSALRERITARAGMDSVHEAFRAEIDALAAENAQLKQQSRERDRELAEQRERGEELEARVQGAERERTMLVGNQAQLEESIRELNRRLNTQSEASQRGAEWEARKLRQRNEQALVLSEQVRELAAQNDGLRAEVERLSRALEEATELMRENARRFAEFDEQFEEAGKELERAETENRELRAVVAEKDKALKERAASVELDNRELAELIRAKDAQLEKLRVQLQHAEAEQDAMRFRLEAERPDARREEELERLRVELEAATESARKLFGAAMAMEEEGTDTEEESDKAGRESARGKTTELRLRLIQMGRELEEQERRAGEERRRARDAEQELEQRELHIARLMAENQRYRKMAFGDAEEEVRRVEKQLEYRDRQIEQLNRRCSELQMELEQWMEGREEEKEEGEKSVGKGEDRQRKKGKRVRIREEEEEPEGEDVTEDEQREEEEEEEEEEYRMERIEEEEEEEETKKEEQDQGRKERKPERRRRWTPDELIRKATDMHAMHMELIRMTRELERTNAEMDGMKRMYSERERHLMEAREAEAKARNKFEQFKERILYGEEDGGEEDPLQRLLEEADDDGMAPGDAAGDDPFKELRLRERAEQLELENMELRRFVENIAAGGGDERERRMAEGTRRLVWLACQEAKLSRRVRIGQRMRAAMAEELSIMKGRMMRIVAGEESRARQLSLDNEVKLFELARLQNALLHSVPIHEHNRLLREHKRLLRDKFLGGKNAAGEGDGDGGYQSAGGGAAEEDAIVEELYAPGQLNIGRAVPGGTGSEALQIRCRRLQELNDVLNGQNDAMAKEMAKLKAELGELNAFLDDLEAETEMKSMLANIERRFVQALREQFEASGEREALQRELQRMERNHRETRDQWLADRQALVHAVGQLHSALLRLRHDNILAPGPSAVTVPQLHALAAHLREASRKEAELKQAEAEMEQREERVQAREARMDAVDTVLDADGELHAIHAALQGYQLNVLTQSAELRRTRGKLEKAERELRERAEELDELKRALANFQYIQGMDLKLLEGKIERKKVEEEKEDKGKRRKEEDDERRMKKREEDEEDEDEEGMRMKGGSEGIMNGGRRTRLVMVDNSAEWAEQLQLVREQARLCVESYKEQLARREKTLEEYRQLVEQLRENASEQRGGEPAKSDQQRSEEEFMGGGRVAPKSAEELLRAGEAEERWERKVRGLERELRMLEEENAEAETERARMERELIRMREEEAERKRRGERKGKRRMRNVKVQVNLEGRNTLEEKSEEDKEDEKGDEDEEEKEEESGGSSGRSGSSGGGGGGSSSDSGTVEDIEQQRKQQNGGGGRMRRRSSSGGAGARGASSGTSKGDGSTQTLRPRTAAGAGTADVETMVLRHRNETRRLRMRVIELERRNKELSDEYASLRERSRLAMRTRTAAGTGGAETPSDVLRRENERLQRQNVNLAKSLTAQREEAERVGTRLRRMEAQGRASTEAWEERKRLEHAVDSLRKRMAESAEREQRLQERLERRERHIEQIAREQQGRLADGARVHAALAQWKAEKAELEGREKALLAERGALGEKCRELAARLEALAREHARGQSRLAATQRELQQHRQQEECEAARQKTPKIALKETHTQTVLITPGTIEHREPSRATGDRIRSAPVTGKIKLIMGAGGGPEARRREPEMEPDENRNLMKLLRRAELLQQETREQLDTLRETHERLLADYNALLRMERGRRARRESEEEEEGEGEGERAQSAGVALLRDKLEAKEREVDTQRHRIIELERKLWRLELQEAEKSE